MSIVARFSPVGLTKEKYDAAESTFEDAGIQFPPEGLELHICFGEDGDLRVSEVWDSREQMDTFGEKLMPVLANAGVEFSGEPEVFEVHRLAKR